MRSMKELTSMQMPTIAIPPKMLMTKRPTTSDGLYD